MGDMHLGALELALTTDNWSAGVTLRSAIDARVDNAGAKLCRKFNHKHLEPLAGEVVSGTARVFRLNATECPTA